MSVPRPLPLAALILLLPAMAAAQQPAPGPAPAPLMTAPRPDDRAATPPDQPMGTPLPPATAEDARRFTGRTVTTQDGKAQAVIHGIADQDGAVTGLILATEAGRTVMVPAGVLRVGSDGTLTIAMTAEALAAAR